MGASISSPVEFNGLLYFAAADADHGIELWKSDGTSAGTTLVKDLNVGTGSSSPAQLTKSGSSLYFTATNGSSGVELWKTDGTDLGTVLVKDIYSGTGSSSPSNLVDVNGILFFSAATSTTGSELWKSDGTAANTVMLKDIAAGSTGSSIANAINANGILYFSANDGTRGAELWKSDGTPTGTVLVSDIQPGATGSNPANLTYLNNTVYFTANDGARGVELWQTSTLANRTRIVVDLDKGVDSSSPGNLVALNDRLYFSATDGVRGIELWSTDGSGAGTALVLELFAGAGSSTPAYLTKLGNSIYFSATTPASGQELWKTDGTSAGTVLVSDIVAGSTGSQPQNLINANGTLYFAVSSTLGVQLWKSDGTSAGTTLVKEIAQTGNSPSLLTNVNGKIFFVADDGNHGAELWVSDGNQSNTRLVSDIYAATASSNPTNFVEMNGAHYFVADDGEHGSEIWRRDLSTGATTLLKDIWVATSGNPSPSNLFVFNNKLYFSASTVNTGAELWTSDGTTAGTVMLKEISASIFSSSPADFFIYKQQLYFTAELSYSTGRDLWKTDGTSAGTVMIQDLNSGSSANSASQFVNLNGTILFAAGTSLWKTDGTTAGTVAIKSGISSSGAPMLLTAFGNYVYFVIYASGVKTELWKSDGTSAGTTKVQEIDSSWGSLYPRSLAVSNNRLFYTASKTGVGTELWVTDGTTAPTGPIADLYSGSSSSSPTLFTAAADGIYFVAESATTGRELWKSDGTLAGTVLVKDITPGSASSTISWMTYIDGSLYFSVNDSAHGNELWKSDGTASGTVLVSDISPGNASSDPGKPVRIGGQLYFAATDLTHGRELWTLGSTAYSSLATVTYPVDIPFADPPVAEVTRGESFVYQPGGFLTAPSNLPAEQIARNYLSAHYATLGLMQGDVASFSVTSSYADEKSGITHLYFRQMLNGYEIDTGDMSVTVMADGRILSIGSRFVAGASLIALNDAPSLSAADAITQAARALGVGGTAAGLQALTAAAGVQFGQTFSADDLSRSDIPVKLVYAPGSDGKLHLAWNLNIQMVQGQDWFDLTVDVASGQLLSKTNWTIYSPDLTSEFGISSSDSSFTGSNSSFSSLSGPSGLGTYNVYPLPIESPNDGSRVLIDNPADSLYSPYGWHDANGVAGAEYTDTRGNNVFAQQDASATNSTSNYRPSGGSNLLFDFPINFSSSPSTNRDAAVTQLFYVSNVVHDVFAHYGFTEAAGNFQVTNYSGAGLGNDAVQSDAQDGSGYNNANFATPPDGTAPRMQMYLFSSTSPYRDSSFDNGVIIHEYAHGLSNRLTGGPSNSNALSATQSKGMGEGWSDFFALMLLQRPGDTQGGAYSMGTYPLGQASSGAGIRRAPYSYDMSINPRTFLDYNSSNEVHDAGEIWASALWDLNWLLINKHGYDSDLYNGDGGNNLTTKLVMDAMKLQPANPSFLDARNAILAADTALTGGANAREIWAAFARRGMGQSAYTSSSGSLVVTPAFDLPLFPVGIVAFDQESYEIGEQLRVTVQDDNVVGNSVSVVVSASTGDQETVVLQKASAGVFTGMLGTSGGTVTPASGKLELTGLDELQVVYTDVNTGSGGTWNVSDTATAGRPRNNLFEADFNDEEGNGATDGFVINNDVTVNPGLWHVSTGRTATPVNGTDHSIYFGQGETTGGGGTYDVGRTAGHLTTPVLTLSENALFYFSSLLSTEDDDAYDTAQVLISANGGTFTALPIVLQDHAETFERIKVDLSAYAGQNVRIRFTFDSGDAAFNHFEGWYLDDIAVTVPDQTNQAPYGLELSEGSVVENTPAGTVIGTFSATDVNGPASLTYSLISGEGDGDNASFEIVEDQLRLVEPLDYEAGSSRSIRVRVTDHGGLTFEKVFNIEVQDVRESPVVTGVYLNGLLVTPGSSRGAPAFQLAVAFDKDLTIEGGITGLSSVLNPANWSLAQNGAAADELISAISFGYSETTGRYEAVLSFTNSLAAGQYGLQLSSNVTDPLGNSLDGNNDGLGGDAYSILFRVRSSKGWQDEVVVNTTTTGIQWDPSTAMDAAGNYVVIWDGNGNGDSRGVYAQRFNAGGDPVGEEFRVNIYTTGLQQYANVAMSADGGFVVTWQSENQDGSGSGIYARRYDSAGAPQGGEFRINTYTIGAQSDPSISMNDSGAFIVTWVSSQDGSGTGIMGRRYDAAGMPIGGEFIVNGNASGNQSSPSAGIQSNGDFTVTWSSEFYDGSQQGIYARQFRADGTYYSSDFRVNTYTTGNQRAPSLAMNAGGSFVIAWASDGQDGSGEGIYAQRYDSSGQRLGAEFRANSSTFENQWLPETAIDSKGNFVIFWWESDGGSTYDLALNEYSNDGTVQHYNRFVNDSPSDTQPFHDIAMNGSGAFIVAWMTDSEDGDSYSIAARLNGVGTPPVRMSLSQSTVLENQPAVTFVGTLSAVDADGPQSFIYKLVSGSGSTDNQYFQIVGNQLLTNAGLNFEAKNPYSIRVRVTDGDGLIYEQQLLITVIDANDAPTSATLSHSSVDENLPAGAVVGTLAGIDPDIGDTVSFELVSDFADNAYFAIVDGKLVTTATFDYEARSSYAVKIRVTDAQGETCESDLTITIGNSNDPPTGLSISTSSVLEGLPSGSLVGTLSGIDPEDVTFTFTLVSGEGADDNALFAISGKELRTAAVFNYDSKNSFTIRARVTDAGGLSVEQSLTISVLEGNKAPLPPQLSPASVAENQPAGTVVGTLSATDPNAGDTVFTYELNSGTGSTDNASFTISGNELKTTASFDFETKKSYSIRVRVTDMGGLSNEEILVITILDRGDSPVLTNVSSASYLENAAPVVISRSLTVKDVDTTTLTGGKVTVTLATNGELADVLGYNITGDGEGQVNVTGDQVRVSGVQIGTFNGGKDGMPLVIDLNQSATLSRVQILLRAITYSNASKNPSSLSRYAQFTVADGTGMVSNPLQVLVTVRGINDIPVVDRIGDSISYTEDQAAVLFAPTGTVMDVDSSNFDTGKLTVTFIANGQTSDVLGISNIGTGAGQIGTSGANITYEGTVIGSFGGGSSNVALTVYFNGNSTPAAAQALLRAITYRSVSQNPSTLPRTAKVLLTDGDGGTSVAVTKTIDVAAVNDAPMVIGFEGSVDFTGSSVVMLDGDATVLDADSADLNGGKMTVSLIANAQGTDVLSIRNQGTAAGKIGVDGSNVTYGGVVVGTFAGGTNKVGLSISFNANATPAAAQALLRNTQFSNSAATRSTDPRTVRILVTDGDGGQSAAVTKTITVAPGNAAPVVGGFDGSVAYPVSPGTAVVIDEDTTVVDNDSTDFNGGKLTITITANIQSTDVLSIRNQGTAAGLIGVSGNEVTYGGVLIGTFTGGTNKVGLTITFNANCTPAAAQALLRALTFRNSSLSPITSPRTVRAILTDGDGGTSTAVTKTINFV